jgi:nickel-dependent lactate racemase
MQIQLKYGRGSLDVEVPDDATVVWPQETAGLADERAALTQALRQPLGTPPLRELAGAGDRVAVVFSDITRPMPSDRVLPALLAELAHVPREQSP